MYLCTKPTKTPGGSIVMTQSCLTNRIIEAMGIYFDHGTPKSTLCMKVPLSKDLDGDPYSDVLPSQLLLGCYYIWPNIPIRIVHRI